jgi:hypothetical protein
MNETIQNNESWENFFEYLTEDIAMFRWTLESWGDPPEGYTRADILWESLNCRSKVVSGLSKIETAPNEYKERFLKLNRLWEEAEKDFINMVNHNQETIAPIIKEDFSNRQDRIIRNLNIVMKIAQDGDLIDEPERFEDDLRAAGNDFLKEFQKMANIKAQLVSDIFQNCIGSKEFVQKFENIEKVFRNNFGYFYQLSDSLDALNKREYAKTDWWLNQSPKWDDVQGVEIPDTFLNDLMPAFKGGDKVNTVDCPESENAILFASKELSEDETIKFKKHLLDCSYCAQLVQDIRMSEMLAEDDPDELPEISPELKKALEPDRPAVSAPEFRNRLLDRVLNLYEKVIDFISFPKMISAVAIACLAVFIIQSDLLDTEKQNLSIIGRTVTSDPMRGEEPEYEEKKLNQGDILKSGEFFQIKAQIDKNMFYYLIMLDSHQNAIKLGTGKTASNQLIFFPGDDEWYQLDTKKGLESIVLILSPVEISNFDQKMSMIKSLEESKIKTIFDNAEIKTFQFKHE